MMLQPIRFDPFSSVANALVFQHQIRSDTLFHDDLCPRSGPDCFCAMSVKPYSPKRERGEPIGTNAFKPMNLQLNHLNAKAAAITPMVVEALQKLVEDGHIDPAQFATLQVQLDWLQYKQNFREMVSVSHVGRENGERRLPTMDMRIDTRQVTPEGLRPEMLRALAVTDPAKSAEDRIPLEDFKSFRSSLAWEFNKRYWTHLGDWEKMLNKGY